MCLAAFSWGEHLRYPLVLAANRDEFHQRPSAPMAWWDDGATLAGRDLEAGGTWLGISRQGRIGLLTNVREPGRQQQGLASRGLIIPTWLDPTVTAQTLRTSLEARTYNGYNLLALDVRTGQAHWSSNRHGHRSPLPNAVHGLSNAALDTPWPKLQRLKDGVAHLVHHEADSAPPQVLLDRLLDLLADRHQPADGELPSTGVPIEWERSLGRIFIEMPQAGYGTRCSTAAVVEHLGDATWRLHVVEQSWDAAGLPLHRAVHQFEGRFDPTSPRDTPNR